ncbi:MAG: prepilin-type cleavage/methylation domain-containing protein, partial [Nitrospinota bacterium]
YNPATRQGEFFIYSDEKDDASGLHIHRKEGRWQYTYDYGSAMYILQERRYQVQDGLLQLILNGDTNNPLNVVDAIENFQVRALMQDGSIKTSFTPADSWTSLQALEVTLTGRTTVRGQEIRRTFSTRLFPRNILSN